MNNPEETFLRKCRKHVFILSSSGKPIFSRRGDESDLVTTFGLLQAIVSIVEDAGDSIKVIRAGDRKILYFIRKSLYFVTVSSTEEPDAIMYGMMEFMYNQILLMLTGKVHDMLRNNSSKDIRDLLGPETDALLKITCENDLTPPSVAFHAVASVYISASLRQDMGGMLSECVIGSGAALGLLIYGNSLIAYKVNNSMSLTLDTSDVLLLTHFVGNSSSLRSHDQNWVPICLPNFNQNAYLQAYISTMKFPEPSSSSSSSSSTIQLVLLASESDPNTFKQLHEHRTDLQEKLGKSGLAASLIADIAQHSTRVSGIQSTRVCLHYLYKFFPSKTTAPTDISADESSSPVLPAQLISGEFDVSLHNSVTQDLIWTTYQRLYICSRLGASTTDIISCEDTFNSSSSSSGGGSGAAAAAARPNKDIAISPIPPASNHSLNYIVLASGHVVVSLASADSELYVTFPSTMSPLDACGQCNYLSRYLRGNVENAFIIE